MGYKVMQQQGSKGRGKGLRLAIQDSSHGWIKGEV